MQELLASAGAAIAAWFAVYFIGKPVVALQQQRIAAKALFEAGVALRAYHRGWSTAVRMWNWAWGYDLDLATQCLFGLAEGARSDAPTSPDARRNTLNALYIALAAHKHLPRETVDAIRRMIAQTQTANHDTARADGAPS